MGKVTMVRLVMLRNAGGLGATIMTDGVESRRHISWVMGALLLAGQGMQGGKLYESYHPKYFLM